LREADAWAGGTPGVKEKGATRGWRASRAGRSRLGSRVGGDAEPIVDLSSRGASVAGIAAREADGGVARKWRHNLLKRLNPRPEMVWPRRRRTHKIWYRGARLTVRKNDKVGRKLSALRNLENSASPRAESMAAEFVAALAERGGGRAPHFPSVTQAELTRSATASTALAYPRYAGVDS
jgi:hypothetical protein